MSAYDRKERGAHFSDAIPEYVEKPYFGPQGRCEVTGGVNGRCVYVTGHDGPCMNAAGIQLTGRADAPEPARCPDTGEPFCTCSAHGVEERYASMERRLAAADPRPRVEMAFGNEKPETD